MSVFGSNPHWEGNVHSPLLFTNHSSQSYGFSLTRRSRRLIIAWSLVSTQKGYRIQSGLINYYMFKKRKVFWTTFLNQTCNDTRWIMTWNGLLSSYTKQFKYSWGHTKSAFAADFWFHQSIRANRGSVRFWTFAVPSYHTYVRSWKGNWKLLVIFIDHLLSRRIAHR